MPRYARRVGLLLAARRHEWALPVSDTFWCAPRTSCPVRSNAAARPRDATGCVCPAAAEASISHAPRRSALELFVALVCRYASKGLEQNQVAADGAWNRNPDAWPAACVVGTSPGRVVGAVRV